MGFGVPLNLVLPLGFKITNKQLRRAGLDYWPHLNCFYHDSFQLFWEEKLSKKNTRRVVCLSKKGNTCLEDFSFKAGDVLLMGNEGDGFPQALSDRYEIGRLSIPILGQVRSYNLANATAMALSEAYRQIRWQVNS